MAEKTIMKMYPNGNLETLGVQLEQSPPQLVNIFTKDNAVDGYIDGSGAIIPSSPDGDKITDFLPVSQGTYKLRITWNHTNSSNISYYNVAFFNSNRRFISRPYRLEQVGLANLEEVIAIPSGVAFVRISLTFLSTSQVIFGKSQTQVGYSFGRDKIIAPELVQHPPYVNHFIENYSEAGYIDGATGLIVPANEGDVTSHFIDVRGWESVTVRIRFTNMTGAYQGWAGVYVYSADKTYLMALYDNYIPPSTGNYLFEHKEVAPVGINIGFIRVTANYFTTGNGASVQVSVERGNTLVKPHAKALEDIAPWAKPTNHPISIFPEGIVIKGNLIQS